MMARIYYILILYVLISCNNKNQSVTPNALSDISEKVLFLDVNNDLKINFETMIDSVEFLSIENKNIIGDIDNLVSVNDSLYLVSDSKFTNTMFLVNTQGQIENTYKYLGKGPNQGLNLQSIIYCPLSNKFECLLRSPNKLLIFDDRLILKETLPVEYDCFRFYKNSAKYYLYCHDNQKMHITESLESRYSNIIKIDFTYYPFNPAPVFYFPYQHKIYFNAPYDSTVYQINNNQLKSFLTLRLNDRMKDQKTKISKIPVYPPNIKNVYETDKNIIIIYSYRFLIRALIVSKKTGEVVSQGVLFNKLGLMGNLFTSNSNKIYGSLSADKFIFFIDNYYNHEKKNTLPKIIFPHNYEKIKIDDNPLIVKYYLKNKL